MPKKIIKSFFSNFVVFLCIIVLNFFLLKLIPGGPFDQERALPQEVLDVLNKKFRLDLSWYEQLFFYMKDLFTKLDFGPSIKFIGQNVSEIIADSLPVSLELGFYALVISIFTGVSLGVLAAVNRGKFLDFFSMLIAIMGVSLPSFLVAALAILFFSKYLGILPAALWDSPMHKILPSIVLGLRPSALIARMTRSSFLEVYHQDFVRTARAKGLQKKKVVFIHVLKNALIPIITILGPLAATILTGSFIIEHIFSVPGLASHFIDAVNNRDYPLVMGAVITYAFFLLFFLSITEMFYALADPRMNDEKKMAD